MYYTTIRLVSERSHNRRWDASKLRDLRKRLDSGTMTVEEIDQVAADFLDGEIVDLASDWLGNTVCNFHRYLRENGLINLTFRWCKSCSKDALQFLELQCLSAFAPILL